MSKTRNGYGGLSLWLSLVGLGAQPPDTVLKIEVHIYNYSKVPHEMLAEIRHDPIDSGNFSARGRDNYHWVQ
jgi:hypothetical protein